MIKKINPRFHDESGDLFNPIDYSFGILVVEFSLDKLAVQTSDISDALVLRALSLTSAGVGTVTEAQLIHLCNHRLSAFSSLWTALWEQGKLRHLRA